MPEIKHATLLARRKSGPENGIRAAIEKRHQHSRPIARVVFEIGILNDDVFAFCQLDRPPQRCAFAAVLWLANQLDLRELLRHVGGDLGRIVG